MTWSEAPAELRLDRDEVHVWRAALDFEPATEELDERECERAARFRFDRDRHRYLTSHSALRRILGSYLNCPPAAVRFEIAGGGKPYIEGPLRFSMSHSGGVALYAVAGREVGVDVERERTGLEIMALARRFFPQTEFRELAGVDESLWERTFFRLWTRREAYLKARGVGLAAINQRVGSEWFVTDLDAGTGYAAAVACQLPEPRVNLWSYGHERMAGGCRLTL